jgi:hypothetical protein
MRRIILPSLALMVTTAIGVVPVASQPEQNPQLKGAHEIIHRMNQMRYAREENKHACE